MLWLIHIPGVTRLRQYCKGDLENLMGPLVSFSAIFREDYLELILLCTLSKDLRALIASFGFK